MALLQLAPLLAMLERSGSGKRSLSHGTEEENALFKTLFEMLKNEKSDATSVQSVLESLEKEGEMPVDVKIEPKTEEHRSPPAGAVEEKPEKFSPLQRHLTMKLLRPGEGVKEQKPLPAEALSGLLQKELSLFMNRKTPHKKATPFLQTKEETLPSASLWPLQSESVLFDPMSRRLATERNAHELKTADTLHALLRTAQRFGLAIGHVSLQKEPAEENAQKGIKLREPLSKPSLPLSMALSQLLHPLRKKSETEGAKAAGKGLENLASLLAAGDGKKTASPQKSSAAEGLRSLMGRLEGKKASHTAALFEIPERQISRNIAEEARKSSRASLSDDTPGAEEPEAVTLHNSQAIAHEQERLSQKIVDAKATVHHFARALQEQVENYKPPFTRMQLSMDPKDLGSVEVTLISRGNNLHIQVHSNPTAIGVMATQGQELKQQLVSMGFTDVQMQFNMNQQQQQQQQQKNRTGHGPGRYLDMEEIPEFFESIDLTLPRYV
ncbi:flagellar hook-length control protein FliK [Hydrogenimonas sp. SS33]|uniref:flagellar hook-length control protein FliK n=1 Tax=Hydrogenimonas leucolamina TaxID=2954236 RepID=UPI00336BB202